MDRARARAAHFGAGRAHFTLWISLRASDAAERGRSRRRKDRNYCGYFWLRRQHAWALGISGRRQPEPYAPVSIARHGRMISPLLLFDMSVEGSGFDPSAAFDLHEDAVVAGAREAVREFDDWEDGAGPGRAGGHTRCARHSSHPSHRRVATRKTRLGQL